MSFLKNIKLPIGRTRETAELEHEASFPVVTIDRPLPPGAKVLEEYTVETGTKIQIAVLDGKGLYYITEPGLDEIERKAYQRIMRHLSYELKIEELMERGELSRAQLTEAVEHTARQIAEVYGFKALYNITIDKVLYYVKRDVMGYGAIDAPFHDPNIEDIKSEGYNVPFVVMHRKYAPMDWLETNILLDPDEQDALAIKLAHMGGKNLSTAFPLAECMLPGGHRLAAAYAKEVTPKGTTITVRKFRAEPFTIIHLMEFKTVSPLMAAYLWFIIERRGTMFVIGETGAGKTTILNALGILLKPSWSIVTIEDLPELNLPHEHWLSYACRKAYTLGSKAGEINQYELLRASLRVRPDFIIIGEVLGEEAFALFQAMAVGQGGLTSFHAESVDTAIKRLVQPPINVDPGLVNLLNCVLTDKRLKLETGEVVRRVTNIHEIRGMNDYVEVFSWDAATDIFYPLTPEEVVERSIVLEKYRIRASQTKEDIVAELNEKMNFLIGLQSRGIREFRDVTEAIRRYYAEKVKLAESIAPPVVEEAEGGEALSEGARALLAQMEEGR
jgi:flagellar protein FlaI